MPTPNRPRISFTTYKSLERQKADRGIGTSLASLVDLFLPDKPLKNIFAGPSSAYASRKQRMEYLVYVARKHGLKPRKIGRKKVHGKAGLDTLKEEASLITSIDKASFSKWVHEKPGRESALTKSDLEKLLAVVQSREESGWKHDKMESSTLDMIPEWILDGRLSHAPLLDDNNEGFRFYWHMEGLSFAIKLAEMLSKSPASVPLKLPTKLMQLGIPDKALKIRTLLDQVFPQGETNDAIASGYESLAERMGESAEGHSPLVLALGYTTAAGEGLHEMTSQGKSVNDHLRALAHAWGVDCQDERISDSLSIYLRQPPPCVQRG